MTKSVTIQERGNAGDHRYVVAEVDITSLDAAGAEPFDPVSLFGLTEAEVSVVDKEEPRRAFQYDQDNTQLLVTDTGPRQAQKSVDPDSQEYTDDTVIATYDAGAGGSITPINFNPATPSGADLSIILRAEYHDGTTTDLASVSDGTEQSYENLVDGVATGDDGLAIRKLLVVVNDSGSGTTEDLGATTTEFEAYNADAANNADVGTVTVKAEGDYSA